jgi:type I restriction enzyme S subunit
VMAKLGEVCLINPKSCTLRDDTEVSFIPMTKVGEHGEFDASEIKNYSEVKKGFTNFQNGDILFAKITPCMENGKGAIAHNMKNGIGFGSTEFHVLRPDTDKITSEWLYYLTTWKTFRKEAERNMTGSAGQKRVPKTFLENYVVNLPDIDTQKSENKILRKVDDLIFLRKQQLAKLDELVKARFVEMFLLHDYPTKTLDELSIGKGEYGAQSASTEYNPSRPRYVRITDVNDDGTLNDNCVSSENISDDAQYKLSYGDFMFARMGATVGKTYAFLSGNQIFAGYLIRYKLNLSLVNPRYLFWYTKLDEYQTWVKLNQSGAAQPGINAKKYGSLKIPVPPIELQNQFATFVARIDQQRQTVQKSLEKLELMKKALMQEYFG